MCCRSRTSSWDRSTLSASRFTWFQPASSFLRLPLDISLQQANTKSSLSEGGVTTQRLTQPSAMTEAQLVEEKLQPHRLITRQYSRR